MKKYTLILSLLIMAVLQLGAQGINFAVTLNDDNGNLQPNTAATVRLRVLPEQETAAATYIETHSVTSNAYGVANLVLGQGATVAGNWDEIDWSVSAMYLKVERAASPSSEFNHVATMRLGAVPYAYHAKSAESLVLTSPDGQKWEVKASESGYVYAESTSPQEGPEYGTVDYIFDMDALPSITIEISTADWNELLHNYDLNSKNEECVHADFYFNKNGKIHHLTDIGLRLRGNTSRVRPEGTYGQEHRADGDFHHIHFGFRFKKFHKDDDHLLSGTDRFNLRWAKGDPTYVHEVYGFDLMRRFGVWTTARSSYCRVFIKFKEEAKPVYYGVSEMFECYDDQYLDDQVAAGRLSGNSGYLWKGGWNETGGCAKFNNSDRSLMGIENVTLDPSETQVYAYDFKGKKKKLEEAKDQLCEFIDKVNNLNGDAFRAWAEEAIDIDLLLRALACEVAIGHWDNMWNNGNNFYVYFDNDGSRKFLYIPYDLDNTLGTSMGHDFATQHPLQWGDSPLPNKILTIDEWRNKFFDYLDELCDPANDFIDPAKSAARITRWQDMIRDYVDNDTHEDCYISDQPASWTNTPQYRILGNKDNYFQTKINSLRNAR